MREAEVEIGRCMALDDLASPEAGEFEITKRCSNDRMDRAGVRIRSSRQIGQP